MQDEPKSLGDVRQVVAEALWDVRYGHLKPEVGVAIAEMADTINNSLRTEIMAWAMAVKTGDNVKHELGALPLNTAKAMKTLASEP